MMDNDPKHTSKKAVAWIVERNINWWKTPPESPDLNPIENLWHQLKEHIREVVKPKTKQKLVDGISEFWENVTIEQCQKYIKHLKKVVPKVIEENGPTGYYNY
uniref:Tc1-like transposase DDE domain-containing protein n=1 Tax=Amphimedon queenslandica TaxID=400682 RepID=A0A1X7UPR5_AMPQE